MFASIPLALLSSIPFLAQGPPDDARADLGIASMIGEEIPFVLRVHLPKLDADALSRSFFGTLGNGGDIAARAKVFRDWVDALKKAGAKDLYFLIDPTNMRELPVAASPLDAGADGNAITRVLKGEGMNFPIRWEAAEVIRNAVVAGNPRSLARIRRSNISPRADMAAALAVGGEAPIQIAFAPGPILRRATEEAVPALPPSLGDEPIATITRGLRWVSFSVTLEPKPALRAILQAQDAGAARALQKVAGATLALLAKQETNNPALTQLAKAIGRAEPQVRGDRLVLEIDLSETIGLAPATVRQAQEEARRNHCSNNLKRIGLAMHDYHAARGHFPAAYSIGKDGKPLLSWRVQILPYLDQQGLYDQFRHDEPWDSPHNKALIPRMPDFYACPNEDRTTIAEGKTTYLTPRGENTIFPGSKSIKIQEILDGTASTLLVIDAGAKLAVTWTEPVDWDVPAEPNMHDLFGHHGEGTNAVFADGAVRFIRGPIPPAIFHGLTTRNAGEVINESIFPPHAR